MKNLNLYIKEALGKTVTLKNLTIKYNGPDELYVQAPESYGESDIQIYLDDTLLSLLPAETAQKSFGKNERYITDAYFEYDRMEGVNGISQKADIEWDDHYDTEQNATTMKVVRITSIKYVMVFEKFELTDIENDYDKIKDTLFNLFEGIINDSDDDMPFELSLNPENMEWK